MRRRCHASINNGKAIRLACQREGIAPADLDLVEINEAFAHVSTQRLQIDAGRDDGNDGAIAIGHPIGTSGARIVLHLALELGRRDAGVRVGVAALCGGGSQGQALILRTPG